MNGAEMTFRIKHYGENLGKPDPQVLEVIASVDQSEEGDSASVPDLISMRVNEDVLSPFHPSFQSLVKVDNVCTDKNVNLRIYQPSLNNKLPVVIYYHGGCWVFCDLESHDRICRQISAKGDCIVVAVDYRLAPEHKFPAAINDSCHAYEWVVSNIHCYGGNANKLSVAGDSAGGNIANAVALYACQNGPKRLASQVLFYPITDISTTERSSYQLYGHGYFFDASFMTWAATQYINLESDRQHPFISPLINADVAHLPATLIQTAEFDILRDEAELYAQKLANQHVEVEAVRYLGMVHAYISMAGFVEVGRQALDDAIIFLRKHWSR